MDLPQFAIDALRRHRTEQKRERLKLGAAYRDDDLVCPTTDGSPMNPESITQGFHRMLRRSGLPLVRFHDLRHAHATALLVANVHPKVVSERLGHANVSITLDTYSHVLPGLQREAAEKLDAVFGDHSKPQPPNKQAG